MEFIKTFINVMINNKIIKKRSNLKENLEREGYNVEFEGDGYVVSQTPQAGYMADKGSSVKLTLKHI